MPLTRIKSLGITDGTIVNADIDTAAAIATSKLGAGAVLQVVTATDLTQRSTTSTSFVTGSNTLSVTITPSSISNKIFITVTTEVYASGIVGTYTIYRGATNLGNGTNGMTEHRMDWGTMCMSYLDSPATTSATTYQVYFKVGSGTGYLNNGNTASITAFEIKG